MLYKNYFRGIRLKNYYIHIEPTQLIVRGRHWQDAIYIERRWDENGDDTDVVIGSLEHCSREFLELILRMCPKTLRYASIRDAIESGLKRL